jgi:hypothetical protein
MPRLIRADLKLPGGGAVRRRQRMGASVGFRSDQRSDDVDHETAMNATLWPAMQAPHG